MARKPTGNPTGRPEKPIDWDMFENLCAIQCTQDEMGGFLGVCGDTLSDRVKEHYGEDYSTVYKSHRDKGKCSLRRNQFVLSKKNASMAIWLGKVWLKQRDDQEVEEKKLQKDLLDAIREEAGIRTLEADGPDVEDKQSLLHQRLEWKEGKVSTELGTEDTTQ